MTKKPKIIVVMPAHNAAKTLVDSYNRLPKKLIDQIILVDDASTDNTYKVAKELPITVFRNSLNLGYGGNLKVSLSRALEASADIIIEFHPDNQYDPQNLPLFLKKISRGYDLALGSRFIHPKDALDRKMPIHKFIANRGLSYVDNLLLGLELSEFHSGFRLYTRKLLTSIPFYQNSDDYLFSFEIIVQAVFYKFKIAEIQVSCDYHPKMHTANLKNSTIYALGTFKTLTQYVISKFVKKPSGPFSKVSVQQCPLCRRSITRLEYNVRDAVSNNIFSIYYCTPCNIGFTHPKPNGLHTFYPKIYFIFLKTFIYSLLQVRRPKIIKSFLPAGKILDIGCGDGKIGGQLDSNKYFYQCIETPFSDSKSSNVKLVGVEKMNEKPMSYNLVTFWESFEHLKNPLQTLKKVSIYLKKGGILIIECPNYNSWERILFGSSWFHLDPPRHLFHFTPNGLTQIIEDVGFRIIKKRTIYAIEYIPIGLTQSILYRISPKLNIFALKYTHKYKLILPIIIGMLGIILVPISYLFYLCKGSPIQLIVAQKK